MEKNKDSNTLKNNSALRRVVSYYGKVNSRSMRRNAYAVLIGAMIIGGSIAHSVNKAYDFVQQAQNEGFVETYEDVPPLMESFGISDFDWESYQDVMAYAFETEEVKKDLKRDGKIALGGLGIILFSTAFGSWRTRRTTRKMVEEMDDLGLFKKD